MTLGPVAKRVFAPWEANPYRPFTWWDVHSFSASDIETSLSKLHELGCFYKTETKQLTFDQGRELQSVLSEIAQHLRVVGLETPATMVESLATRITWGNSRSISILGKEPLDGREVYIWIQSCLSALESEARRHVFFRFEDNLEQYYNQDNLFGEEVANQYDSANFDIREAGNCFALGRSTACVYHLMRVLELILKDFAYREFQIEVGKENWQQIINLLESRINKMPEDKLERLFPNWKELQAYRSEIVVFVHLVKDAWRNYVSHSGGKFTMDEAEEILKSVRSFATRAAKRRKDKDEPIQEAP